MSRITKAELNLIRTLLKNRRLQVALTPSWRKLYDDFGIGRIDRKMLVFSQQDFLKWQKIALMLTGVDLSLPVLPATRTETSMFAHNEKWAVRSVQEDRVYCTALNSYLFLSNGMSCPVIPAMEYRWDYREFDLLKYDAIMLVENFEAYLNIHSFIFSWTQKILVIYRGHDVSSRAAKNLLQISTLPVYGFYDIDPSGLGMLLDNKSVTHGVFPFISDLVYKPGLESRFAVQVARRPNLREQSAVFSEEIQQTVGYVLDNGIAATQESLCANKVALRLVKLGT